MESAVSPLPVLSETTEESEVNSPSPEPPNEGGSLGDAIANAFNKRQKRIETQEAEGSNSTAVMEERKKEPEPALDFQSQLRAKLNTLGSNKELHKPKASSPKVKPKPQRTLLNKQGNDSEVKKETAPSPLLSSDRKEQQEQQVVPSSLNKEDDKPSTSLADEVASTAMKHSTVETESSRTDSPPVPVIALAVSATEGNE